MGRPVIPPALSLQQKRAVRWPPIIGWLSLMLAVALSGGDARGAENQPRRNIDRTWQGDVPDLPWIRWSRRLRVLVPATDGARGRQALRYERRLVEQFAERHYLEPVWITVPKWSELIPELLRGKGDLIAANLTVTEQRKKEIRFTLPVHTAREQLVVRTGERIESVADLRGREIAVRAQSAFWGVLQAARKRHPGISVHALPESVAIDEVLRDLLEAKLDIAAVDTSRLDEGAADWAGLKIVPALFEDDAIAWGVHPGATELLAALNDFISKERLARREQLVSKEDLGGIRKRGVLRVLTRNTAATYFLWRGAHMGFEYDLLKKFAGEQKLHLEVIVPSAPEQLLPALRWGGGDVVAASLPIPAASGGYGAAYTRPFDFVNDVLIARADDYTVLGLEDLEGRTVVVRRGSAHWKTLDDLRLQGLSFLLKAAPENMETEELIARIGAGTFDLTVAPDHIVDVELSWRNDVRKGPILRGPVPHGWAVRPENPELLHALNAFLEREYRGLYYNVTREKYFGNLNRTRRHREQRVDAHTGGHFSPYDGLVRKYAGEYGFDWPLIVAQMYQESRFNRKARSFAGARGLLQMLPRTAKQFGASDLLDPEQGIRTGVAYLSWLHKRFDPELAVRDRMWFALAAYNAGYGHVRDARKLARAQGWDPNRWFGHVERAMRLLAKRKYNRDTTHGYARGYETVKYVREIRDRYNAYVQLAKPR